jgi:hypothetical protein
VRADGYCGAAREFGEVGADDAVAAEGEVGAAVGGEAGEEEAGVGARAAFDVAEDDEAAVLHDGDVVRGLVAAEVGGDVPQHARGEQPAGLERLNGINGRTRTGHGRSHKSPAQFGHPAIHRTIRPCGGGQVGPGLYQAPWGN